MGEIEVVGNETGSVAGKQEVGELKNQAKSLGFTQYLKERHSRYFQHQSKILRLVFSKNSFGGMMKGILLRKMETRDKIRLTF